MTPGEFGSLFAGTLAPDARRIIRTYDTLWYAAQKGLNEIRSQYLNQATDVKQANEEFNNDYKVRLIKKAMGLEHKKIDERLFISMELLQDGDRQEAVTAPSTHVLRQAIRERLDKTGMISEFNESNIMDWLIKNKQLRQDRKPGGWTLFTVVVEGKGNVTSEH